MLAIIATAIISGALGIFFGLLIAAGSRAETDQTISRLRYHLIQIISEANHNEIKPSTIISAQKTLNEQEQ